MTEQKLKQLIREEIIKELSRLTASDIRQKTKYWALYATSYYEKLFKKINDKLKLQQTYKKLLNKIPSGEPRDAFTFFYRLRRDELEKAFVW